MKRTGLLIVSLVSLGLLAGCGSTPKGGPDGATGTESTTTGVFTGDGSGGVGAGGALGGPALGGPPRVGSGSLDQVPMSHRISNMDAAGGAAGGEPEHIVHFDFNSSLINDEASRLLIQNARWILAHNPREVIVEGHCDERGTRDYNLALGQKRADEVKKFLVSQGLDWYRVKVITYGKERPLVFGHDEFAWAKNRRAELRIAQ
ncbi:MAG: OmpA family protein [Magnetococcales bacterium]|nr:OmpA family protein [Magnetococcales bacterium]